MRKINQLLFLALMISFNFGNYIKVYGLSLSWIFAGLLLIGTSIEIINNPVVLLHKEKKYNIVPLFAGFWFIYSCVQIIWVQDLGLWKSGVISNCINVFICFEVWFLLENHDDFQFVLKSSAFSWLLCIGIGGYELLTGNHFIFENISYWERDLVRTFFGNPNDCASWFVLSFYCIALYLIATSKRKEIFGVVWTVTTFLVVKTGSRACLLGMLIFMLFYILMHIIMKFENSRVKGTNASKVVFVLIVSLCTAIVVSVLMEYGVMGVLNKVSGKGNVQSDSYRLDITRNTLKAIWESAFMGCGAYQSIKYIGTNPHNFLLELFADYGIIIFGCTCFFMWDIFSRYFDKKQERHLRAFYFAYTFSFIITSISSSSMNRLRMTWICLLVIYLFDSQFPEKSTKII